MSVSSGGGAVDLEVARQVVSEAERVALEKAELFCTQAEALLKSLAVPAAPAGGPGQEQLEAELQAMRQERDEARERAAAAEGLLMRMRREQEALLSQVRGQANVPGQAHGPGQNGPGAPGANPTPPAVDAEAERQRILAAAKKEADELVAEVRRRLAGEISEMRQALGRAQERLPGEGAGPQGVAPEKLPGEGLGPQTLT